MRQLAFYTFVLIGGSIEPRLKTVPASTFSLFITRTMVTDDHRKAVRATFGADVDYAIPAWERQALLDMQTYEGPNEMAVRGFCAAIALGLTVEELVAAKAARRSADKGGNAKLVRPKPRMPSPAGYAIR